MAFRDTEEGKAFLASADSLNTDVEILEAIAFFARNLDEAQQLWRGDGYGVICHATDIWEHVTGNGQRDPDNYCWGAAGDQWWPALNGEA